MNQMCCTVNHCARITVLVALPVDFQPEIQILRVPHLVRSHQPGSGRPESVTALSLDPLTGTFYLEFSFGDIVDNTVASNMIKS